MRRYLISAAIVLLCSTDVRAQVSCITVEGITSCSNGYFSQRIGEFDFDSNGGVGQNLGGGIYTYTPGPTPYATPSYPTFPEPRRRDWRR